MATTTATTTKRPRKEATPSKPPPPKYITKLIDDMVRATTQVNEAEERLRLAKDRRDEMVKRAREKDISYNEIAEATGMSISWINSALIRTDGWRPRQGRPRRKSDVVTTPARKAS
jgi:DNA-directed RNA polymerase specialized sigma24 family protein